MLLYPSTEKLLKTRISLDDLAFDVSTNKRFAIRIIEEYTKNLSMGLLSVIGSYGPEIIYINSQITRKIPVIIEGVQEYLSGTIYAGVPIRQARNAEYASLFGGCVINIQIFLNIDKIYIEKDSIMKLTP